MDKTNLFKFINKKKNNAQIWAYLWCNDSECKIFEENIIPQPHNKKDIQEVLHYKLKRGMTGNNINRRKRSLDEPNYGNVYENEFALNYGYLNAINLPYQEFFTLKKKYKKPNNILFIILVITIIIIYYFALKF